MPLPQAFEGRLRLPAVAAPLFLISDPELVTACCRAGIVGTFPALNARTTAEFEAWLAAISEQLAGEREAAPFGVNLIVHRSNRRLDADLEVLLRHPVPLVITSLGAVSDLVAELRARGTVVFHDVATVRHIEKAAAAGVDGLVLVCAGAGGHAGRLNPFAFIAEARRRFSGTLVLAGALSTGRDLLAARLLGADLAYLGTRMIATRESRAPDAYKRMLVAATADDVVYTDAVSGIPANFLKESLQRAGIDPAAGPQGSIARDLDSGSFKAWRDIWSAGQGVAAIHDLPTVAELVGRLEREWREARAELRHL